MHRVINLLPPEQLNVTFTCKNNIFGTIIEVVDMVVMRMMLWVMKSASENVLNKGIKSLRLSLLRMG